MGGIYFNPPSLDEPNREHNDGGNSLINNSFNRLFRMKQENAEKTAQDNDNTRQIKDEEEAKNETKLEGS